jgi:uncharacterized protein (TIGR00290 family)
MKVACLISGGKDSLYSYFIFKMYGADTIWVNFVPKNLESYMLQSINSNFVKYQAKACGEKLYSFEISGKKDIEIEEMLYYLKKVKEEENFEGIVCGAVRSDYQKSRLEYISEELGVNLYAPLWHKDEKKLLDEILDSGFEFLIVFSGLEDKSFVGKIVNKETKEEFLNWVQDSPVGEGGEFESYVINCPIFEYKLNPMGVIKKGYYFIEKIEFLDKK